MAPGHPLRICGCDVCATRRPPLTAPVADGAWVHQRRGGRAGGHDTRVRVWVLPPAQHSGCAASPARVASPPPPRTPARA
eukprot:gene5941-5950_t